MAAARALLDGVRADLRGWEWEHVNRLTDRDVVTIASNGRQARWSPDGRRVLTLEDWQTGIPVWDAGTGKPLPLPEDKESLRVAHEAIWSPTGDQVVALPERDNNRQPARVWNANTWTEAFPLQWHTGAVTYSAFSADGSRVVTCGDDVLKVWDVQTGKELLDLKAHNRTVRFVSLNRDGSRLLTTGHSAMGGRGLTLWDARTGKELHTLTSNHLVSGVPAAFSPDGSRVATADGPVQVWDAKTGEVLLTIKGHAANSAVFTPDGARLVTASEDVTRVWDARKGTELMAFRQMSLA